MENRWKIGERNLLKKGLLREGERRLRASILERFTPTRRRLKGYGGSATLILSVRPSSRQARQGGGEPIAQWWEGLVS